MYDHLQHSKRPDLFLGKLNQRILYNFMTLKGMFLLDFTKIIIVVLLLS
ncbi:hypothetical protein SD77_2509 [Bacillus badius]|uniref:Mobile element protein n=1 Tax=Bacillus badius TaxID=1455 RepID=A0ABR5AZK3_BACBA|nr:hypothetical protein SD78_2032 [Bacillus badius]KIL80055.1 hypothetical protein SD77_2509 [Bacillus badius]